MPSTPAAQLQSTSGMSDHLGYNRVTAGLPPGYRRVTARLPPGYRGPCVTKLLSGGSLVDLIPDHLGR
jgi:hypothetical protein